MLLVVRCVLFVVCCLCVNVRCVVLVAWLLLFVACCLLFVWRCSLSVECLRVVGRCGFRLCIVSRVLRFFLFVDVSVVCYLQFGA